jgi:hypothetical protein
MFPHSIGSLGFEWNGQIVKDTSRIINESEFETIVVFGDPIIIDSWYFTTSAMSPNHDPIRFFLEISIDGKIWQKISSPQTFVTDDCEKRFHDAKFPTSNIRGYHHAFDFRLPWQIKVQFQVKHLLFSICFLWLSSCYYTKLCLSARLVTGITCIFSSLIIFCCGISYACANNLKGSVVMILRSLIHSILGSYMIVRECNPLGIALADAVSQLLVSAAQSTIIDWEPASLLRPAHTDTVQQLCIIVMCIYGWVHQRKINSDSLALILADKLRYDFWFEVLRVTSAPSLAALDRVVTAHHQRQGRGKGTSEPTICRQLTATGRPVSSIRHLYRHAALLDMFLREKMHEWSTTTPAYLPTTAGSPAAAAEGGGEERGMVAFERLDKVERMGAESVRRLKWVKLKGINRAIEKLYRRYDGDVSRLLDICRQVRAFAQAVELC